VEYIRKEVVLSKKYSALLRLSFSGCRESNIYPSSKEILCIPFGFAMAQEDEFEV
jgi:hypothetical protein